MSGISSISSSSVSDMWQMHLKNADTNGDSQISKTEFSAETAKMQKGKGTASTSTEDMFAKIDTNSDGNIDETEFKSSVANMAKQGNTQGAGGPPPGGPPPGGPPPSGGSGTDAAQADSSTVYDKRDTNQDGIVDAIEALAYSLEHPEVKAASTSSDASAISYTNKGTANNTGNTGATQLDVAV